MSALKEALKNYELDTEPGAQIPQVEFESDGVKFTAIGYRFGDGSAGFDVYHGNGEFASTLLLDQKSTRKFLKFIEGILK